MLNEQLTSMALFSHIDQPGLSWRTRLTQTKRDFRPEDIRQKDGGSISGRKLSALRADCSGEAAITGPSQGAFGSAQRVDAKHR